MIEDLSSFQADRVLNGSRRSEGSSDERRMQSVCVRGRRICRPMTPFAIRLVSMPVVPFTSTRREGFNDRVRRTVPGVFHHISPHLADLYFNEIGFRWSQRVVTGQAPRRTRRGTSGDQDLVGDEFRLHFNFQPCTAQPLDARCDERRPAGSTSSRK